MKKKLFLVLISTSFILPAIAINVAPPVWEDICPDKYINATSSKLLKNNDYWYNRRVEFNNQISQCKRLSEQEVSACYEQVREKEMIKNKEYQKKEQARAEIIKKNYYNTNEEALYMMNNAINSSFGPSGY